MQLVVPYFDYVQRRVSVLPFVKTILSSCKTKSSLRYSDDDFGGDTLEYGTGESLCLICLGSLEADDDKKPDIDKEIEQLKAKIN